MATKGCEQCGVEKDIDLFRKVTNQYTGVHPMKICKACYKANQEEWQRKQEEERQRTAPDRERRQAFQRQWEEREAARMAREAEALTLSESKPTEVTSHTWIYAYRKEGSYPEKTEYSGKWLIFLSPTVINHYWQKIKDATEQGLLGDKAKTSTAANGGMPPEVREKKIARGDNRYVICVYTYNYVDRDDVMRIRQVLRELGIKYSIRYKANADTHKGNYGSNYKPIYEL